jgi:hypothetical protein
MEGRMGTPQEQPQETQNQSSEIAYCEERHRLLDQLTEIVVDLVLLHERQVTALIEGDTEFNRFDQRIHIAAEKKLRAKYAYIGHVEAHGCCATKALPIAA